MEDKKFTVCIVGGGSRYTPGILKMLVAEQGYRLSPVFQSLYHGNYGEAP